MNIDLTQIEGFSHLGSLTIEDYEIQNLKLTSENLETDILNEAAEALLKKLGTSVMFKLQDLEVNLEPDGESEHPRSLIRFTPSSVHCTIPASSPVSSIPPRMFYLLTLSILKNQTAISGSYILTYENRASFFPKDPDPRIQSLFLAIITSCMIEINGGEK